MRFTSKFKKKLNGSSTKHVLKEHLDENHYQDIVFDSQFFYTRLKFADCKYGKFVPKSIGGKIHDKFDLVAMHNMNSTDAKRNRFKHLQIIAKFIFSSAYCSKLKISSKSIQMKKRLKSDTYNSKTNELDTETIKMLEISQEFLKIIKKTVKLKDPEITHKNKKPNPKAKGTKCSHALLLDYDQKYRLTVLTQAQHTMTDMENTKARVGRNESFTKPECNNNSVLSSEMKRAESLFSWNEDPRGQEYHLRTRLAFGDHKTAELQCQQSRTAEVQGHGYAGVQDHQSRTTEAKVQDHQVIIPEAYDNQLEIGTHEHHSGKAKVQDHQLIIPEAYDNQLEIGAHEHHSGKAKVQDHQLIIPEPHDGKPGEAGAHDQQSGKAMVHDNLNESNHVKHLCEATNKMLEIHYSSRVGEINERHCNAVYKLVDQRLNGKFDTSLEVCVFIQENVKEIAELVNMRLDLTHKCLSAYFFPGKNLVSISVQRDLKKFLNRTVFQKTTTVKDLFGERHCSDDDLNIKAVIMVSHPISALIRHQDICLLDTLQVILGIDTNMLLVLKVY